MKRTSIALAIGLMASGSAFANTFVNGAFGDGNLGSLTGSGCWGGGSFFGYSCDATHTVFPCTGAALPLDPSLFAGAPNNTLVGVGVNPISGNSTVYGGGYAARLNDSINNTMACRFSSNR